MKVYQTKDIRNVALIGAAKSGKTSIAEAMMFETGIINRLGNIEDKNTVSDYRPIELDKKNSVSSTVLCAEHKGKKINIIDTPGFPGYRGDVFSALSVADAAVIVVNAQNETEIGTERKFRWATKHNLPTIFVVNHLDHDNINFDNKVSQLKGVFKNITLVQYPVNAGPDFDAFIDVLQMKMFK
ncbi:MAG: GTP-binding protein, partial [Bacteroidota bacterium]|nr:GTP-binding protein [Bacteroidota bacterium]